MSQAAHPNPSPELAAELHDWRIRLLNVLLVIALALGGLSALPTALNAIHDPAERPAMMVYSVLALFSASLLLARRLDVRWRSVGALVAAFTLSTVDMATGGLAGSGRVYLIGSIALTMALMGWRAGIGAGLLSMGIYAGFGIAVGQGWVVPMRVAVRWWASEGLGFAMTITVLLMAQGSFVQAHRRALERALQAEQELSAAHTRQLRIARDLHDETVQQMYGVILALKDCLRRIGPDPEEAQIRATLDSSIRAWEDLRGYLQDLRSPQNEATLAERLEWRAAEFTRLTNLPVQLEIGQPEPRLPTEARANLVAIAQAALSNIYCHAQATTVWLRLHTQNGEIVLQVQDDGIGFDPDQVRPEPGQLGLVGIRERAQALKGQLEVESAPLKGTRLTIRAPLEKAD
jgi:signal transduction histidine kinase